MNTQPADQRTAAAQPRRKASESESKENRLNSRPLVGERARRVGRESGEDEDEDMDWGLPSPRHGGTTGQATTTATTTATRATATSTTNTTITTSTTSTTSLAGTTTTVFTTYCATTSVPDLLTRSAIIKSGSASPGKDSHYALLGDSPTRRQVARKLDFGQADTAQADQSGTIPIGEVRLTASTIASPPKPSPPRSPYSGASRGAGIDYEVPGFYRPADAPLSDASQPWQEKNWIASEEDLVGFILDREPELLVEEESRMIWQAAMQPSTVALEMLMQRGIAFYPWQRSSNRGWREEHCPFTAAIKHERADNLRLLLNAGARPGPELELVLSRQPAWAQDIFRQYDYML